MDRNTQLVGPWQYSPVYTHPVYPLPRVHPSPARVASSTLHHGPGTSTSTLSPFCQNRYYWITDLPSRERVVNTPACHAASCLCDMLLIDSARVECAYFPNRY